MNKCIHSFQNEKKVNQLIIELKKLGKDIEKYFLKNLIKIEGKLIKTNRNVLSSWNGRPIKWIQVKLVRENTMKWIKFFQNSSGKGFENIHNT